MKRVVFAPDSFKGTIAAADAARVLAEAWLSVDTGAEPVLRPMADGGEGTVAAFATAVPGAQRMPIIVDGPAGHPIETAWLLLPATDGAPDGTAVIDMASTSGIELLDDLRPLDADSRGFGQAIGAALDHGVSRLVLGIGSSASTDGGTGVLRALGASFLAADGSEVAPGARGLPDIVKVDIRRLRAAPEVRVLTDVTNPLTGPRGAAAVFGPQKGLVDVVDQQRADAGLARLAELLALDPQTPGAGAAGGVGAALLAWGGALLPGAAEVAHLIGLADAIADADIVVTGEGAYDGQSGDGKVPSFVASLAGATGAHALLVAGRIDDDADTGLFASARSLTELAGSSAAALAGTARWLHEAGRQLAAEVSDARPASGSSERVRTTGGADVSRSAPRRPPPALPPAPARGAPAP